MSKLRESRRSLAVRYATSGVRIQLEDALYSTLLRYLRRGFRRLSTQLEPILPGIQRQAQGVKLAGKYTAAQLRRIGNEIVERAINSSLPVLSESERLFIQGYYRTWVRLVYELGAVNGARLIGLRARSPLIEQFSRQGIQKAAGDLIFELSDAQIINALESRAIRFGANLSEEILREARRLVRDKLYLANASLFQVAKELSASRGIAEWRALAIARTEAQAAYNAATFKMFVRSGIEYHAWITVGDARVRTTHVDNEMEGFIPVGEPFPNGALHPGDGPDSINCRCSIFPDLPLGALLDPWDGSEGFYTKDVLPDTPWIPDIAVRAVKPVIAAGTSIVLSPRRFVVNAETHEIVELEGEIID